MAAALPWFSDKTSAWSGDKYELWRGTEEEAAQITTATIPGFGGAGRSRGHCLASVSYFVLLLKVFLGCDDISQNRGGGKHFKCFCKVFLPVCFVQSFKSPTFLPGGEKEGRGNNSVKNRRRGRVQTHFMPVWCGDATQEKVSPPRWCGQEESETHRCSPRIQQVGHKTTVGCRWCSGTCVWTLGSSPGWLRTFINMVLHTCVACLQTPTVMWRPEIGKNQRFQGPVWKST